MTTSIVLINNRIKITFRSFKPWERYRLCIVDQTWQTWMNVTKWRWVMVISQIFCHFVHTTLRILRNIRRLISDSEFTMQDYRALPKATVCPTRNFYKYLYRVYEKTLMPLKLKLTVHHAKSLNTNHQVFVL